MKTSARTSTGKIIKKAGIIILILGLLVTMFTGLSFVTREKVVDIGELEINTNKNHSLSWSPAIGVMMMAIGAGFYLLGPKNNKALFISTRN